MISEMNLSTKWSAGRFQVTFRVQSFMVLWWTPLVSYGNTLAASVVPAGFTTRMSLECSIMVRTRLGRNLRRTAVGNIFTLILWLATARYYIPTLKFLLILCHIRSSETRISLNPLPCNVVIRIFRQMWKTTRITRWKLEKPSNSWFKCYSCLQKFHFSIILFLLS